MGTPGGEQGEDPSRPHAYVNENFIFQMNIDFTSALDDAGVAYTSDFHNGYHHWPYWQRDLHRALPRLVKIISG
jgi:S-formylglutathione hydrolase FrmB